MLYRGIGPAVIINRAAQTINRIKWNLSLLHILFCIVVVSYLSFWEVQLLCGSDSLPGIQVLVLVENLLQFVDLLRRKLGAHAALGPVPLPIVSLVHRKAFRGSSFALIPRRISANFWNWRRNTLVTKLFPLQGCMHDLWVVFFSIQTQCI